VTSTRSFLRAQGEVASNAMLHADYRPDIDGLRAVAILSVVAFHAFPGLLTGGFAGVDVFFVISGFLISGIILRALARGDFSCLDFYARRVKRIFPALVVMFAGVGLLGWAILLPDEYELLGKHIAAGGGFVLNLSLFIDTREYFGAIHTPLVHLWSLGVEEQFYLIWPLLLLLTSRWGKGQLLIIVVVASASFVTNVMLVASHPLAAFYVPVCRLWELAIGSVLAYVQQHGGFNVRVLRQSAQFLRGELLIEARSLLGLLLLIASFVGLDSNMAFPGWWAATPGVGAALLISGGPRAWINRRVLSHPLMVGIGLISYPLYLWHWPLLSLAHTADWRHFTPGVKIAAIAISFVLAFLTYRYVERPIRASRRTLPLAGRLCAAMVVCIVAGVLVLYGRAPPRPVPKDVSRFLTAATEDYPYPDDEGFLHLGGGSHQVLFIGDSTMAQYYPRVTRLISDNPELARGAVFAWRAGCAPDPQMSLVDPPACQALIEDALRYAKRPEVDTVVIGFCWYAYFLGILDTDHVGEAGPLVPATGRVLDDVGRVVADLRRAGKRVYLVLQTPLDPSFDPRQMIRRVIAPPGFEVVAAAAKRADLARTFEPFVSRLTEIAQRTGAHVLDPLDSLCDAQICRAVTSGGEPVYRDSFHLRKEYVRENIHYFDPIVVAGHLAANTPLDH
jgi:peptidoglycan/LPS O-acetylase OafA/YrhL